MRHDDIVRTHRVMWGLLFVVGACGTDSDGVRGGDDEPFPDAPSHCAEGFYALPDGAGCEPLLPSAPCAPGTRAQVGTTSCIPVGVTTCATGFTTHASGWGCDAVLPRTICTGAKRERLGTTACAPIADCNAPFPPAEATLFVHADYTDDELDATHFRTVTDALGAAAPGAVIAVDAGVYAEKLRPTKSVTIAGRCAEQVIFTTNDGSGSGLVVTSGSVTVRNMTLRAFPGGVTVSGGNVDLEGLLVESSTIAGIVTSNTGTIVRASNIVVRGTRLLEGANQSMGLLAQKGARVEIDESVFVDNDFANIVSTDPSTSIQLRRSIVRDGRPPTTGNFARSYGMGIYVTNGATLAVGESAIVDNAAGGLVVNPGGAKRAGASATMTRSVVRGTKMDPVREHGRGAEVGRASSLVVEQSTLCSNSEFDLLVAEGATADIRDTTTFGTASDTPAALAGVGLVVSDRAKASARSLAIVSARAVGIQVQELGNLDLSESLVIDPRPLPALDAKGTDYGFGVVVKRGCTLALKRSTIDGAHTLGLLSGGGTVTLEDALITRTTGSPNRGHGGRGISAQDGATLDVRRSAIVDNLEVGIIVIDGGASLSLRDSTVGATHLDALDRIGIGVLFSGNVTGTIDASTITASEGIGLAAEAAGCFVRRSFLSHNTVALHAQDGAKLVEGDSPASDPLAVVISRDTWFVQNVTRIGQGLVPLPSAVAVGR